MAPAEETMLEVKKEMGAMRKVVEGLRSDFRVFQTKLMGDDEEESEQGRIPRLEKKVEHHGIRIARIERYGFIALGIALFLREILRALPLERLFSLLLK